MFAWSVQIYLLICHIFIDWSVYLLGQMVSLEFNFWSVIILVCAVQGLFLTVVFYTKGKKYKANRVFSLLLFLVSLHLIEYALCISGVVYNIPHILFTTYPLFFLVGPLFYFYVCYYLSNKAKLEWKALHFLPALLYFLMLLPFYMMNGIDKINFFRSIAVDNFQRVPQEQFAIMLIQGAQILIYLVFSHKIIRKGQNNDMLRNSRTTRMNFNWLLNSTKVFGLFILFYMITTTFLVFSHHYRIEFDYMVVLVLSLLIYLIGYTALLRPNIFKTLHDYKVANPVTYLLKKRLSDLMMEQEPYLNEDLKIEDLASSLGLPVYQLSLTINHEFGCNFFEFVNSYRIERAKELLSDSSQKGKKILAIAFESGFGNKATFNRVFKEYTSQTPTQYRNSGH